MAQFVLALLLSAIQTVEAEPVILRGDGQQASRRFDLDRGLAVFKLTYAGNRYFSAWLVDQEGTRVDLLVNQVGGPSASRAAHIRVPGRYQLQVKAGGEWTAKITQPRPTEAPLFQSVTGLGQRATRPFRLEKGRYVFSYRHGGQGYFNAQLLDHTGQRIELLANEAGRRQGSQVIRVPEAGIYLMNVKSSGDWSVDLVVD